MWDLAGTSADENKNADETASIKLAKSDIGLFFVEDCFSQKISEHDVEKAILSTAQQDGKGVRIGIFQDPGQAGKAQARRIARMLAGYDVKIITANKDTGKIIMAKPVSAQAEARNIFLVKASWNELFITRVCNFPGGKLKDIVDALSGAFKLLTEALGDWASGDC
jgi:predicted phage terminase large subunit-like protein